MKEIKKGIEEYIYKKETEGDKYLIYNLLNKYPGLKLKVKLKRVLDDVKDDDKDETLHDVLDEIFNVNSPVAPAKVLGNNKDQCDYKVRKKNRFIMYTTNRKAYVIVVFFIDPRILHKAFRESI